jgi:hypothetical protein
MDQKSLTIWSDGMTMRFSNGWTIMVLTRGGESPVAIVADGYHGGTIFQRVPVGADKLGRISTWVQAIPEGKRAHELWPATQEEKDQQALIFG